MACEASQHRAISHWAVARQHALTLQSINAECRLDQAPCSAFASRCSGELTLIMSVGGLGRLHRISGQIRFISLDQKRLQQFPSQRFLFCVEAPSRLVGPYYFGCSWRPQWVPATVHWARRGCGCAVWCWRCTLSGSHFLASSSVLPRGDAGFVHCTMSVVRATMSEH